MSRADASRIADALGRPLSAPLADALSSVVAARAALSDAAADVVLKALEPRTGPRETLDDLAGGAQFGPWPPALVFVARGDAEELVVVTSRANAEPTREIARLVDVQVTSGAFDWYRAKARRVAASKADAPRASKRWAEAALVLDVGGAERRVVLATTIAPTEEEACASLDPLAKDVSAWARREPVDEPASPAPRPATLEDGATLAWSREGDVIVLRDYANAGPTRYAAAYRTTSIVSLVVAVALAGSLAVQAVAGAPVGALIGTGAVAAVLLVNAFAFFRIAGFAGRYASDSLALAWFGDDKLVVGPWLSRYGAVDTRPSGRLGAAIPTAEVNGVARFERDGMHAVEVASEHGPLEIVRTPSASIADEVTRVAQSLLEAVAAPKKPRSAKA